MAECKVTEKVYVGCTTRTLRERKEEHHLSALGGSQWKFHKAIREHGFRSFEFRVADTAQSEEEMFRKERVLIARYNSFRCGYNSTEGGRGSPGVGLLARARPRGNPAPFKPKRRRLLLRR